MPAAPTTFRIVAPQGSNETLVDPRQPLRRTLTFTQPAPGTQGVGHSPTLTVTGSASSYLFAIADAQGTLQWLAESSSSSARSGASGTTVWIDRTPLAPNAPFLSAAVALDGTGSSVGRAVRVAFTTAP
jgi:hypothetical protein